MLQQQSHDSLHPSSHHAHCHTQHLNEPPGSARVRIAINSDPAPTGSVTIRIRRERQKGEHGRYTLDTYPQVSESDWLHTMFTIR